jgi:hypothetical protein
VEVRNTKGLEAVSGEIAETIGLTKDKREMPTQKDELEG